jgi:gliding motility-associated-like protein
MKTLFKLLFASLLCSGLVRAQQNPSAPNWSASVFQSKAFIENKGQFDLRTGDNSTILYSAQIGDEVLFTPQGPVYCLFKPEKMTDKERERALKKTRKEKEGREKEEEEEMSANILRRSFVRMEWVGGNASPKIVAEDKLTEYWNYTDPRDRNRSINNCAGFRKLVYKNVYPGIDVEYTFHPVSGLKYALIVHPGADASKVRMHYAGADRITADEKGSVHIRAKYGEITDHAPETFYEDGHGSVSSAFALSSQDVTFQLGNYDHSKTVVIDPWTNTNFTPVFTPVEVGRDASNNAYVFGHFGPQNFSPITMYVQKYSAAGALQWTFNVNSAQPNFDCLTGDIAVDPQGNSYITDGLSFTVIDCQMIKISPAGAQVWCTPLSPNLYENWRAIFNCDYTQLVQTGCSPGCCNGGAGDVVNTATGNETTLFTPVNNGDMVCTSFGKNGYLYGVSVDDNNTFVTHITALDPSTGFGTVFSIPASFTIPDGGTQTYGPLGFNGIAAGCAFLYVCEGTTLEKRNLTTGALLGSVPVPGGSFRGNSGLAVDKCGNVYVGSSNGVYVFDASLAQIANFPTPYFVTDIVIGTGTTFYACGGDANSNTGFLGQFNSPNTCPSPITFNSTNPSCSGTGSATANPVFCSAPYTYAWSNGQTTQTATGLGAGTYTVIVSGAGACNEIDTATVTLSGSGLNITALAQTNVTCFGGNNGSSTSGNPSGGQGPYTFSWTTTPSQSNQTATGLAAGNYTVYITDAAGCSVSQTVTITQPTQIVINSANTPTTCSGNTGTATANPNGGTSPYTYLWNNGQTTQTATGLAQGSYTCTVTDAAGCTSNVVVAIVPIGGGVSITSVPNNVTCNGACNGNITATPTTGSGPFTYSWAPGGATTQGISSLCPGSYTVFITDANGCQGIDTIVITEPAVLAINPIPNSTVCSGQSASLAANANGGTPNYGFLWMPGNLTGSAVTVTPSATTTYTVAVSDANGCTAAQTVTVTVNALPVVTFTADTTQGCAPLCVTFTNTSANSATCSWDFGDVSQSLNCTALHCYANPGTYTVSLFVTDNNGCANSLVNPNMITVYPNPTASFSASPNQASYYDPVITFQDLSTGASTWTWTFGDPASTTSNVQNPSCSYPDTGTYVVTLIVTNQFGCADTAMSTVYIYPEWTFYAPNSFTPNGDGHNDVFMPYGTFLDEPSFQMWIYDRWGQMIFYTDKWGQGWDGRANGGKDIAQIDVYEWLVKVADYSGKKHKYVGHVSLIK